MARITPLATARRLPLAKRAVMRRNQAGMTTLGLIILVSFLGLFAFGFIRLTPVYLNYFKVVGVVDGEGAVTSDEPQRHRQRELLLSLTDADAQCPAAATKLIATTHGPQLSDVVSMPKLDAIEYGLGDRASHIRIGFLIAGFANFDDWPDGPSGIGATAWHRQRVKCGNRCIAYT